MRRLLLALLMAAPLLASAVYDAGEHKLEIGTNYRIVFDFHGETDTTGKIVNFNVPGFLLNSHSLSGATTCRFDRIIRAYLPSPGKMVKAHYNTYKVTGPVYFENLQVREVTPRYAVAGDMELGDGEKLICRRYSCRTDFSSRSANAARAFYSAKNGKFHDPQWRMGAGGEVVYRHELKGRKFQTARVSVNVARAPSAWALEWSKDGKNWIELQRFGQGAAANVELPRAVFPLPVIYIRVLDLGGKGYDLVSYSLEAGVDADAETRLFGRTTWIDAASGDEIPSGRNGILPAKGFLLPCDNPVGNRFWTCDSGWKVSREQPPPSAKVKGVQLRAAANEAEAVQFVIRPEREIAALSVNVGDLCAKGGAKIPASAVEVLRVGYLLVDNPSDAASAPGWWPDPLFRLSDTSSGLSAGENNPFWVRVKVPKATAKGVYRGRIELEGPGLGRVAIPLAVEVFGFELPDEMTCKTAFGMRTGPMRKILRLGGAKNERLFRETVGRYAKCLADHRITTYDAEPWNGIRCRWENSDDPLAARPVFDWSNWDGKVARSVSNLNYNTILVPLGGVLGSGTYQSRRMGKILKWQILLAKYLGEIDRHLVEKGWAQKSYAYWFDEPREKDYAFVSNGMARLKKYAPNIKRMITARYDPAIREVVNLWCPTTYDYHSDGEAEVRRRGDEMWWYVCCVPKSPYATEFIDKAGTEMRVWLWQTWGEKSEGILIWDTLWWSGGLLYDDPDNPQNPYLDPQCWCDSDRNLAWGNGDGRFLYPPPRCFDRDGRWIKSGEPVTDDPVESYRLEMLRDGIEDYEYFAILSRLDPDNPLLKVPKTVYSSMTSFTADPAPMAAHRRRLAAEIERLSPKYGR
jgi:hypothetical protein